ncbi:hypothetical protein A9Q02_19490 [Candidatus Chloroploca asiatica]|uniref:Glutamine cyclotransferase n=1 Tax=Candidatus Chloroploca asiatica TaxID=1506545 RepID=A0A2H3KIV4_9CHLR|nr:hypothetical protein A9Q02_19490 [Candidatus Chloroploca asiatica]
MKDCYSFKDWSGYVLVKRRSLLRQCFALFVVVLLAAGCTTTAEEAVLAQPPTVLAVPSAVVSPVPTREGGLLILPDAGPINRTAQVLPDVIRRSGAPVVEVVVVATYPHDPEAFTQGLVYHGDDRFYESTGLYGASTLREVALDGTQVREPHMLESNYFAEGIALVGDLIFQLTWQERTGFVYDRADFREVDRFRYPPQGRPLPLEGWGLTFDGTHLIMSDGTANLYFIDPEATLQTGELTVVDQVEVYDRLGLVPRLNELEYIEGDVYANIWFSDLIARIDPKTGQVKAYLDLSELRDLLPANPPGLRSPEVLNGIAYDAEGKRLFVTGKLWPQLFQIEPLWRVHMPYVQGRLDGSL